MKSVFVHRLAPAALVAAFVLPGVQPASAADEIILPAGTGCEFNLGYAPTGGKLHTKEFTDADGNVVRSITAGKGVVIKYTNYGSDPEHPVAGKSVTIRTDGSVAQTVTNPDGTLTVTATGHNGLILFPSDVPKGPSTLHYIGRLVYIVDPATGVFTFVSSTGPQRDICAELK
jgi:hypothetical protein